MPKRLLVLWLILFSLAAFGCSRPGVKADGSSTVLPITEAVQEEFQNENGGMRIVVGRSGTGGGFKKFSNQEIDICNASRPISEVEKKACAEKGIEYLEFEIAYDGLAVCVNPKNTWCECLTVAQLKSIWEPGTHVRKWSDLEPKWPAEEIELYGAGTDSGTFDYFTKAIVGKERSSREDYSQSEDDNVLATGVAGDLHSLGYFGLAYYEENRERLKLLGIDPGEGNCVKPSAQTVRENTYRPLSRPLFIYVRKSSLARPEVRTFVKYYLGKVSELVEQVGYVPVPDETMEKNRQLLEAALEETRSEQGADV